VLLTVSNPTPIALLERIAVCDGWDVWELPRDDPARTARAPPSLSIGDDGAASIVLNEACIIDEQLDAADRLLDFGLVHVDAPLGLCVEALLYSYLFQTNQAYFAGRLDRIFSLDDGRCAELLVAAAERAYPGGDYGRDEWARMYADPIARDAQSFLCSRGERAAM
jgi:hypothetical protein